MEHRGQIEVPANSAAPVRAILVAIRRVRQSRAAGKRSSRTFDSTLNAFLAWRIWALLKGTASRSRRSLGDAGGA